MELSRNSEVTQELRGLQGVGNRLSMLPAAEENTSEYTGVASEAAGGYQAQEITSHITLHARSLAPLSTGLAYLRQQMNETNNTTQLNTTELNTPDKSWPTLNLADIDSGDNDTLSQQILNQNSSDHRVYSGLLVEETVERVEYTTMKKVVWTDDSLESDLRETERPLDALQQETYDQTGYTSCSPESVALPPTEVSTTQSVASIPVVLEDIGSEVDDPAVVELPEPEISGDQLARHMFRRSGQSRELAEEECGDSLLPDNLEFRYRNQDEKAFKSAIYTFHFLLYLLTDPTGQYRPLITWMSVNQPTDRPTNDLLFKILDKEKTVNLWREASFVNCSLVMKATWGNLTSRMRYANLKGYKFFERIQSGDERYPRKRMFRFGEWAHHLLHDLCNDPESIHSRLGKKLTNIQEILSS